MFYVEQTADTSKVKKPFLFLVLSRSGKFSPNEQRCEFGKNKNQKPRKNMNTENTPNITLPEFVSTTFTGSKEATKHLSFVGRHPKDFASFSRWLKANGVSEEQAMVRIATEFTYRNGWNLVRDGKTIPADFNPLSKILPRVTKQSGAAAKVKAIEASLAQASEKAMRMAEKLVSLGEYATVEEALADM